MDDSYEKMTQLAQQIAVCEKCQLHLSRKKSVPGEGNIHSKILFIGEGPGLNENETGRPFVGQAGNFLNELLSTAKLKRQDVFITNVVKCRPPANRDPLPEELTACSSFLDEQIRLIDPLVIVTLGRFSMGRYFPLARISSIHGKGHWVDGRMIVPMFHPAAALHQPNLRDSIMHDFALLPTYIHEVEEKITAEPVENANPASEAAEKKEATDGVQLSLF
ncbi:MAG TPA: uracil-DNA glycosylase [Flexilinea sp.]|jgi:DNA polymerase|nr:uracil-DNA glycosylase [Flexilinea sp.]OQA28397.1 MAG: Uracil DNA glycosylase superfamily protein [Chloroflexi bacterium ADurb.Bin344]HNY93096.1 uracil-DNA glycosylase [Flexilinea sp.]HOG21440.1 uracil-DNA glycosylase [Flexilinea sp.]HOG60648.1 uracil-DNA glycosylase [Flexilinea sp.]